MIVSRPRLHQVSLNPSRSVRLLRTRIACHAFGFVQPMLRISMNVSCQSVKLISAVELIVGGG